MTRRAHIFPVGFVLFLSAVSRVSAEPIRPAATTGSLIIRSGTMSVTHAEDPENPPPVPGVSMRVAGDGFSINDEADESRFFVVSAPHIDFPPPLAANPSFGASGPMNFNFRDAVIGDLVCDSHCNATLSLGIAADAQPLPRDIDPNSTFVLTYPFLLAGLYTLITEDEIEHTFRLSGRGIARTSFSPWNDESGQFSHFSATSSSLEFESAAPVPEPGTILLFATGVAFSARRALKRRG